MLPNIRTMPVTAYNRTVCTIRDYPRMVCELEQLKQDAVQLRAAAYSDMPKGSSGSGGLDDKVARMTDLEKEVNRIREVIDTLPSDMRKGIMDNVLYGIDFPRNEYGQMVPSRRTWQRVKRDFITLMAHKLRIYNKSK